MIEIGTDASRAAEAAADTLDALRPGWWNTDTAEDLAGPGGDLYTAALQAACSYQIERRRAVDQKLAELTRSGAKFARRETEEA